MIAEVVEYFFVFLFGLCAGSFLNCAIYRMEQKKTMSGRSFCPNCKHVLNWKDLFPVASWLFLAGKCRYCKTKISAQYPLVETATGILFAVIFWKLGFKNLFELAFMFYIAAAMVFIFVYDLKHFLIPDKVLLPAIAVALIYRLFNFSGFLYFFCASLGVFLFFLILFLVSKGRWMGFGDVKLVVLMGLVLGVKNVLVALFLAFFIGAAAGVILMIMKKKGIKSEVPFAPFLIAGTFLALVYGDAIVNWYLRFLI